MTLIEAIEILKRHNQWRRGEVDSGAGTPAQVSLAIDMVIDSAVIYKNIIDEQKKARAEA